MYFYLSLIIITLFFLIITVIKAITKKYEGYWIFAFLLLAMSVLFSGIAQSAHAEDKIQTEISNLMYDELGINENDYVLTKTGKKSNGYTYNIKMVQTEYEVLVKDNKILGYQLKE